MDVFRVCNKATAIGGGDCMHRIVGGQTSRGAVSGARSVSFSRRSTTLGAYVAGCSIPRCSTKKRGGGLAIC